MIYNHITDGHTYLLNYSYLLAFKWSINVVPVFYSLLAIFHLEFNYIY